MNEKYLDVYKLARCVKVKETLDSNNQKFKQSVVAAAAASDFKKNVFSYEVHNDECLLISIPALDCSIQFNPSLKIINGNQYLKISAREINQTDDKDIITLYLERSGAIFIGEIDDTKRFEINDQDLFLDILDAILKKLQALGRF
ncbi:hypothetical protein FS593_05370 [Lelliottia amnigena]|uniref:hypothetical protein n=1 Tax=Lelliottia amnigena TaxID=61646 RepID=UPI001F34F49C|nr:hypothetical protein [Lelliottia amnigena]UJD93761.1 hypothetical protein FS593_05370 [Lelliottia amnigena]